MQSNDIQWDNNPERLLEVEKSDVYIYLVRYESSISY